MFIRRLSGPLRLFASGAAIFFGGTFALGFISGRLASVKKKKHGRPCRICREKGYWICKLCKGNGSIEWSPLYDPVFINPCLCPTCDGAKIQRCLNCLGYGSV